MKTDTMVYYGKHCVYKSTYNPELGLFIGTCNKMPELVYQHQKRIPALHGIMELVKQEMLKRRK